MRTRLWSFHPVYLDNESLIETWEFSRKAATALRGWMLRRALPYCRHPALERFKACPEPVQAISDYMHILADVGCERKLDQGMLFNTGVIPAWRSGLEYLTVTAGQMELETWLYGEILVKERGGGDAYYDFWIVPEPRPHPLFRVIRGAVEKWEKLPPHDYTQCKNCGDPIASTGRGKPAELCSVCRPGSRSKRVYA